MEACLLCEICQCTESGTKSKISSGNNYLSLAAHWEYCDMALRLASTVDVGIVDVGVFAVGSSMSVLTGTSDTGSGV